VPRSPSGWPTSVYRWRSTIHRGLVEATSRSVAMAVTGPAASLRHRPLGLRGQGPGRAGGTACRPHRPQFTAGHPGHAGRASPTT
jgi:hypothetical protein